MKSIGLSIMCIVLLLAACSRIDFTSVRKPATPLIDSFQSYARIVDVQTALTTRGILWAADKGSPPSPGDPRPPFDILTISVPVYGYLGQTGALELLFFNNRLMEVRYFADNPASFVDALESQMKVPISTEPRLGPFTRVWIGKDGKGRVYVGWQDTRLSKEQNLWITKYS